MNRSVAVFLALAIWTFASAAAIAQPARGRLMVTWSHADAARSARQQPTPMMTAIEARVDWVSRAVPGLSIVEVPPGRVELAETVLLMDPDVVSATPDVRGEHAIIPNDTAYSQQYQAYTAFRQCLEAGWDIHRTSNVRMVVLDTGSWYNQADMNPNQYRNPGEDAGDCDDGDNSGINDDLYGGVFLDMGCCDPSPPCAPRSDPIVNGDWHGNHVQSILAARGNHNREIAGIVWNGTVMSVRVFDDGGFWWLSDLLKGTEYAYYEGARLMNMSLQGSYAPGQSPAVFEPLRQLMLNTPDALYVVAAGNCYNTCGIDLDNTSGPGLDIYPAEFDVENMLAVGASDGADARAPFSNYGAISADVFAPGVEIVAITYSDGGLFALSGTSMATPIATGTAALLWDMVPSYTPTKLRDHIRKYGSVIGSLNGRCVGAGNGACTRINLAQVLGGNCP